MTETLCTCDRWIVEVDPGIWAHIEDLTECSRAQPLPVIYLDEAS